MNNTVKELSEAVRRYAAEQGEEFDLRKNADLVHFGMWLLSQNSGKPIVSRSAANHHAKNIVNQLLYRPVMQDADGYHYFYRDEMQMIEIIERYLQRHFG